MAPPVPRMPTRRTAPPGSSLRRASGGVGLAGPARRQRPLPDFEGEGEDLLAKPVKHTGGLSAAEQARVRDLTAGIRENERRQRDHMKRAGDVYYYRVFVFESEAQADAFMGAVGYPADEMFVDGRELAARMEIALPSGEGWKPKVPKRNAKFTAAARRGPEEA